VAETVPAGWNLTGATCSDGSNPSSINLGVGEVVTCTFNNTKLATLTVVKAGTGSGTVTSSPAGIDCGSNCSNDFTYNTVVTLTATADTGSTFTGWTGAGCTGTGTCVVTMDAARSVTATFTTIPQTYMLYLPLVFRNP
jgi:hypothetical protein